MNSSADHGRGMSGRSEFSAVREVTPAASPQLHQCAPLLWKTFQLPNLVDYAFQTGQAFRGKTARPQCHALHPDIPDRGQ